MFETLHRISNFHALALFILLCLAFSHTGTQAQTPSDYLKIWTSVGSAGTVDEADTGKVEFKNSAVQLKGSGIIVNQPPDKAAAKENQAVYFPTESAVIRYNVTPVDGLFMGSSYGPGSHYGMTVRYWASGTQARVVVRLIEVDLYNGQEVERMKLDSVNFPSSINYQVQGVSTNHPNWKFDFTQKAYYIEATLTKSSLFTGGAAGLSIVKLNSFYPIL